MRIERISDAAGFEAMAPQWQELLEASAANCIFLTWDWLFTWWARFGAGARLEILAVREGERLIGLAPLCRRQTSVGPWLSAPTLEFLGTGSVGSDYLDLIVRRGCEPQVLDALAGELGRGDALTRLTQLRPGAAAFAFAARLREGGFSLVESQTDVCPFIRLSGHTWESYLQGLGPEHRYNVRRKLGRMGRGFDVYFEEATSEAGRRQALSTLIALHRARFETRGGSEAFDTPSLVAFHEEWSGRALARGWLRLFVLRLDGEPVAALYGFRYGRTFSFYQAGFDPARAKESPGLACMAMAIQRAIQEGAEEYDLLHGDEAYKFLWARETRPLTRIELFPSRPRAVLWQEALGLTRATRKAARQLLPPALATWIRTARRNRDHRTGGADAQPA
jgi:CelD/BcsL family acetyltransferase involved in cellulose biosynthesis